MSVLVTVTEPVGTQAVAPFGRVGRTTSYQPGWARVAVGDASPMMAKVVGAPAEVLAPTSTDAEETSGAAWTTGVAVGVAMKPRRSSGPRTRAVPVSEVLGSPGAELTTGIVVVVVVDDVVEVVEVVDVVLGTTEPRVGRSPAQEPSRPSRQTATRTPAASLATLATPLGRVGFEVDVEGGTTAEGTRRPVGPKIAVAPILAVRTLDRPVNRVRGHGDQRDQCNRHRRRLGPR